MKKLIKLGIGIAVIALIALFAFIGIRAAQQREVEQNGVPRKGIDVDTEAVHRETITTKVSAKGTVALIDQTIVYAQTSAKLTEVNVRVGDVVKAGQVLARYDDETLETLAENMKDAALSLETAQINMRSTGLPASETERLQAEQSVRSSEKSISDLNAQLAQTDISLEQARRNLEKAKETHERNETLYAQGVLSKNDLDASADSVTKLEDQIKTTESQRATQALAITSASSNLTLAEKQYDAVVNKTGDAKVQNQLALQRIQVEQAQRQIDKIQKQIDEFVAEETAPIDGVVLAVSMAQGETAQAGRALFTIADTSNQNLVVTVYIPENEAKEVALNQKAELTGGALGSNVYEGFISKIYPIAEKRQIASSTETAITVDITATGTDVPLKAGYTLDTNVITDVAENVVVVPLMSVLTDSDGTSYVYVMTPSYTAARRTVVLKSYASLYVEAEGVEEGELVIVNPPTGIEDGTAVRPSY